LFHMEFIELQKFWGTNDPRVVWNQWVVLMNIEAFCSVSDPFFFSSVHEVLGIEFVAC